MKRKRTAPIKGFNPVLPTPQVEGRRQEKALVNETGSEATPNSGASDPLRPLDVEERLLDRKLRLDLKTTTKKSISVKLADLENAVDRSMADEVPGLVLVFTEAQVPTPKRWILLPYDQFQELKHHVESRSSTSR